MNDTANPKATKRSHKHIIDVDDDEGDTEVWATFNSTFRQVQSVLDRNRNLIRQVNENHQSRTPDSMVKNVALIQELNGNISRVVSLYSDLSSNFSTPYQQRNCDLSGNSNSSGRGFNEHFLDEWCMFEGKMRANWEICVQKMDSKH